MDTQDIILTALIFVAAVLYASVGHAGASGYLAAMALLGIAPDIMKPAALTLNILVALIGSIKFYRAGAFSWHLFWPLALASVPFAYMGGTLTLPGQYYKPLVGVVLIYAAWRSYRTAFEPAPATTARPPRFILLLVGAALGFLSGLTGIGGGIFLSPLLLFFHWAEMRVIAGISALFILANSTAGLLGAYSAAPAMPAALPYWALAAVIGGFIGAEFGSNRFGNPVIQRILAVVLLIAGAKMIATA